MLSLLCRMAAHRHICLAPKTIQSPRKSLYTPQDSPHRIFCRRYIMCTHKYTFFIPHTHTLGSRIPAQLFLVLSDRKLRLFLRRRLWLLAGKLLEFLNLVVVMEMRGTRLRHSGRITTRQTLVVLPEFRLTTKRSEWDDKLFICRVFVYIYIWWRSDDYPLRCAPTLDTQRVCDRDGESKYKQITLSIFGRPRVERIADKGVLDAHWPPLPGWYKNGVRIAYTHIWCVTDGWVAVRCCRYLYIYIYP